MNYFHKNWFFPCCFIVSYQSFLQTIMSLETYIRDSNCKGKPVKINYKYNNNYEKIDCEKQNVNIFLCKFDQPDSLWLQWTRTRWKKCYLETSSSKATIKTSLLNTEHSSCWTRHFFRTRILFLSCKHWLIITGTAESVSNCLEVLRR